jgi:hypothetical protein
MIAPALRLVGIGLVAGLLACGGATPTPNEGAAPSSTTETANLLAAKCAGCHVAPQPKQRSRPYVESALARHQKRVHLTPAQKTAIIEYLSDALGSTAQQDR